MDNRRFNRFPCLLQFHFYLHQTNKPLLGPYLGKTINVSAGGLLFTTTCPLLRLGGLISVKFVFDQQNPLLGEFFSRIVRINQVDSSGISLPRFYQVATDFKFINEANRGKIISFLNRYLLSENCSG